MIISKQNRRTIYMALFQEGVLVAPKNFEIKHPNLDVPNLEVIKAMQSLDSKGYAVVTLTRRTARPAVTSVLASVAASKNVLGRTLR